MEIERPLRVQRSIKVQPAGSEKERRRRRDTDEEFRELLDANVKEDAEQDAPPNTNDTVSISLGDPDAPLVNDLVSISTAARVGAEVASAKESVDRELALDTVTLNIDEKSTAEQATESSKQDQLLAAPAPDANSDEADGTESAGFDSVA